MDQPEELCPQENITSFRKIKEKANTWASSSTENRAGGNQRDETHTSLHRRYEVKKEVENQKLGQ